MGGGIFGALPPPPDTYLGSNLLVLQLCLLLLTCKIYVLTKKCFLQIIECQVEQRSAPVVSPWVRNGTSTEGVPTDDALIGSAISGFMEKAIGFWSPDISERMGAHGLTVWST